MKCLMKLDISISGDEGEPRPFALLREGVLVPCLSAMLDEVWPDWRDKDSVSISISVVGEADIRGLNRDYRNCDSATDVLSFPCWEEEGVFCPPDWPDVPLGDVIICSSVVEKNALDHGVTLDSEMALMVVHSVLHLVGYDHDEEERRLEMWDIQERFRDRILANLTSTFPEEQEG